MTRHAVADRAGLPLAVARGSVHHQLGAELDPHKDLKIVRSFRILGDLPVPVTFDFAGEGINQMVHVVADVDGKRVCGLWSVAAVKNRDAKLLGGFREFADMLDRNGAQLAHIIMGLRA